MVKVVAWIVGIVALLIVLHLAGIDVVGWIQDLWAQIKAVPPGYIFAALAFQTGQTLFAGLAYYGILHAAYPDEAQMWPIITAYAVGVSMNGFLPANLGTFVTLMMFVAIIPSCTFAGATRRLPRPEDLLHDRRDVRLPLPVPLRPGIVRREPREPLRAPGPLDPDRRRSRRPDRGARKVFWKQLKKLWEKAKEGGVILTRPKEYFARAFLPAFLSWLCKLAVIGIFLAAFAIPVTFESVMWITGSGSLANVVSFTPGAVGITQATNALALSTCCDVPESTTIDYSTAQQLITTAWNVVVAVALVVIVFGWTGGKLLVGESYTDAKVKVAEQKEQRAEKKATKKAEREVSGESRFHLPKRKAEEETTDD